MASSFLNKFKSSPVFFVLVYWLVVILFFQFGRVIFLLFNIPELKETGTLNVIPSAWYGLRMDMSMAAYLTIPILLLCLLALFIRKLRAPFAYIIYTAIILLLVLILLVADLGLFNAWGFRLDATPLAYLKSPKEAWASVSHLPIFSGSIIVLIIFFLLMILFSKGIRKLTGGVSVKNKYVQALFLLLLAAASIIPLRGGFQLAPINQSSVYFSKFHFANQAALNPVWNLVYSLNHNAGSAENPYVAMEDSEAGSITDSLLKVIKLPADSVRGRVNVVLVIWEGFTAKAVNEKHEGISITPGFNKLSEEGIYFPNVYASGDRTDKGIAAILSAYPAQPVHAVLKSPVKAAKLPSLPKKFKGMGYHTSFYYGGETEFANIKAYLVNSDFDEYITISDFKKKDLNSKWGAHDGVVAEKIMGRSLEEPFFLTWLTLSSHEPFEIPSEKLFREGENDAKYLDALHYSDSVVYNFVEFCKRQSWWNNTILAIVPDHGNRLPSTGKMEDDFRIPVLFLGGKVKPVTKSGLYLQTDVAATLLALTGNPANEFSFSRNMMDSLNQFGFFSFNNGFGYLEPGRGLIFDNTGKRPIRTFGRQADLERRGKALQQRFYQDFLEK